MIGKALLIYCRQTTCSWHTGAANRSTSDIRLVWTVLTKHWPLGDFWCSLCENICYWICFIHCFLQSYRQYFYGRQGVLKYKLYNWKEKVTRGDFFFRGRTLLCIQKTAQKYLNTLFKQHMLFILYGHWLYRNKTSAHSRPRTHTRYNKHSAYTTYSHTNRCGRISVQNTYMWSENTKMLEVNIVFLSAQRGHGLTD